MPTYDSDGALLISLAGVVLDHEHSAPGDGGPLAVGVTDTDLTPGSVWFAGVGGLLQQDNANLFWDDAANEFGIKTNTPGGTLDVAGEIRITANDANAAGVAQFYRSASSGLVMTGYAGTTFDLLVMNATNDRMFVAPTGTADLALVTVGGGSVAVGLVIPLARLHVDNVSAAQPVLYLDQGDVSEEMIQFESTIGVGNAIEAVGGKTLTTTHFIKVTLPGALTRYFPVGTIA